MGYESWEQIELDECKVALHNSKSETETLHASLAEARKFGEDAAAQYNALLAESQKRTLTCAFCGHEYPPDTPPTQHEALTAHVLVCEKHPLRAALATAEAERSEALKARDAEVAARHEVEAENARLRGVAREAYQEGFQAAKDGAAIEAEAYSHSDARKALEDKMT